MCVCEVFCKRVYVCGENMYYVCVKCVVRECMYVCMKERNLVQSACVHVKARAKKHMHT
jgi:hypothetical protein